MAISIQFYGIDAVIEAFKNRGCSVWGLFQGRQFLFKSRLNDGMEASTEFLENILDSIADNPVIYTLKVYEVDPDVKINEKTASDGSFNFKIIDEDEITLRKQSRSMNGERYNKNNDRIGAIEAKLDQLLGMDDDDDGDGSMHGINQANNDWESVIMGYVANPAKLLELFNALTAGTALITGNKINPAMIGNVLKLGQKVEASPGIVDQNVSDLSQEQNLIRLSQAIDLLAANDPKIIDHLEKLARLSMEKPEVFKVLLTTLEGM